ncbi:MAG: hypothetical protein MRY72_03240, partial [Aquisalinus sp.]|nr:hypothetical protein [Aquisalinus sp.]
THAPEIRTIEDDDLAPLNRIRLLESALDGLTLQIASEESLINPDEKDVRLLQDQVRLVASHIRSYQKLEDLKESMGWDLAAARRKEEKIRQETDPAPETQAPSSASSAVIDGTADRAIEEAINSATIGREKNNPAGASAALPSPGLAKKNLTRAERRRQEKAARKAQKNNPTLTADITAMA